MEATEEIRGYRSLRTELDMTMTHDGRSVVLAELVGLALTESHHEQGSAGRTLFLGKDC